MITERQQRMMFFPQFPFLSFQHKISIELFSDIQLIKTICKSTKCQRWVWVELPPHPAPVSLETSSHYSRTQHSLLSHPVRPIQTSNHYPSTQYSSTQLLVVFRKGMETVILKHLQAFRSCKLVNSLILARVCFIIQLVAFLVLSKQATCCVAKEPVWVFLL